MSKVGLFGGEKTLIDRSSLSESGKWVFLTDNTLKLMSFGLLCGGAFSMIAFRSITSRAACTAFGAGWGIGKSYVDAKYILGHDVPASTRWTAKVTPNTSGSNE